MAKHRAPPVADENARSAEARDRTASSDRMTRPAAVQATIYDRTMSRFSVIVADDHPLFRDGVVRAVRGWPELELVAEVSNGREALDQIRELAPDVACVDLRLPEIDGIGIANAVTRDRPRRRACCCSRRSPTTSSCTARSRPERAAT